MIISQITPTLNNSTTKIKKDFNKTVTFTGATGNPNSKFFAPICKPVGKQFDKFTDKLANVFGKFMQTEKFGAMVKRFDQPNSKIVQHLTCLTSLVLSGFYIKQTLQNDQLDKQKKNTLAINQGIVAIASAISSYTLDGIIAKQTDKFIDRFVAVNTANVKKIGTYVDGIKSAQSIIVFGTVYRLIAPVLLTPIANSLGNKYNEKQEAKRVGKND